MIKQSKHTRFADHEPHDEESQKDIEVLGCTGNKLEPENDLSLAAHGFTLQHKRPGRLQQRHKL